MVADDLIENKELMDISHEWTAGRRRTHRPNDASNTRNVFIGAGRDPFHALGHQTVPGWTAEGWTAEGQNRKILWEVSPVKSLS